MLTIKEDLLQYIWKFQKFDKKSLYLSSGQEISIYNQGMINKFAGPDFENAKIFIDGIQLYGHIEIHINASDWYKHKHENDVRFNNVILHVVWNNDIIAVKRKDGTQIPTLELKSKISHRILETYKRLMNNKSEIPCSKYINSIGNIDKLSMLEKALFQRLTNKNSLINKLLKINNGDWEETAFQLLAYTFGFKINGENLLELSKSLQYKILKKHSQNLFELEAILLGQANLFPKDFNNDDKYTIELREKYKFLKHKYDLKESKIVYEQWKFFRLRPANFPTIRIVQLAKIINNKQSIFDLLINNSKTELYKLFDIDQSEYWQNHYVFLKKSKSKIPGLGKSSIENIMINSIVPLLISYGKFKDEQIYIDKAINILQDIPSEKNHILDKWINLGLSIKNAFDSQAYIELFNNYCNQKKCLNCNIGCRILGRSEEFQDLLEASLTKNKNI